MSHPVILFTGCGGGIASNLITTLRNRESYTLLGTDKSPFKSARAPVERAYVVPPATSPDYLRALTDIVAHERPQLIIPTNDAEVEALSNGRENFEASLYVPPAEVVRICADKLRFHEAARNLSIPMAPTWHVGELTDIPHIFAGTEARPLWVRPRFGGGSVGATRVRNSEQAQAWIRYWNEMRGFAVSDFLLSEFLPGRDFACQGLWQHGRLHLMKAAERLAYIDRAARPSNMSSSPELARTVQDQGLFDLCIDVVGRLAGEHAHGVFAIDLKQGSDGRLYVTEVNAGRFFMISNLFNLSGRYSMIDLFIELHLTGKSAVDDVFDYADRYLIRALDTLPTVASPEQIRDRIYGPVPELGDTRTETPTHES